MKVHILIIVISLALIGSLFGIFLQKLKDTKVEKQYPVRVYLYGEQSNSYFDCDSANLNYAWKDGIKIQLKDVYQIKFK